MASNRFVLEGEDGDYPNWIEIHNAGEKTVNLKGIGISDASVNLFRWSFPETDISPGEYLIVFASGKDRRNPEGEFLHTNSKSRLQEKQLS